MKIKNITVLGAGHGGYAAAADLTLRGFIVTLFTFSEEKKESSMKMEMKSHTAVYGEKEGAG